MNTLVVTVEGLGASLVGAYGSSLARTPTLDHVASCGITLDQCFLDSCDRNLQLRSLWTGVHAAQSIEVQSIWQQCEEQGIATCLLTDCLSTAEHSERFGCSNAMYVPTEARSSAVESMDEARCHALFSAASEELAARSGLVWVHSRGLRWEWDAPLQLRSAFIDPEDPEPPAGLGPPSLRIDSSTDPDLITGWGQVAAAQTAILDDGIGSLVDTLSNRQDASEWAWLLAGLGGTPLGEHGQVGFISDSESDSEVRQRLFGEELAVPVLLWPRSDQWRLTRRGEIFQLPDLAGTVMQLALPAPKQQNVWGKNVLDLPFSDTPTRWKGAFQRAIIKEADSCWLRVPAWSSVHFESEERFPLLFVKPEDRWEASDIADRRKDVVEAMDGELHSLLEQIRKNDRDGLQPIAGDLCSLMR